MRRKCENCRHWDNSVSAMNRDDTGRCTALAPVVDPMSRDGFAAWPFTDADDRCGQFAADDEVEYGPAIPGIELQAPSPNPGPAAGPEEVAVAPPPVDAAQIKHMVDRFLSWPLPEDFRPDGGIRFEPVGNKGTPYEYTRVPSGTNLLDAVQAEAMVRYMVAGMPAARDIGELAAADTTAMLTLADVRKALEPFADYARKFPDVSDVHILAIETPSDGGEYAILCFDALRHVLRAAGVAFDHRSDDEASAATGQDDDADAPVRASASVEDAPPAGASRADHQADDPVGITTADDQEEPF